MALTINTNVPALFAQQSLAVNNQNLADTLQRLSTGLRINNASDDAAGLAIAETMQQNVSGLNVGSRNGNDGVSMLQTAQGAMLQVLNDLQRMSALATQAASGTNNSQALTDLNTEYQALLNEIERVSQVTTFNGVNVLTGGSVAIQIGAGNTSNDQITITLGNATTGSAGLNIAGTDLTSNTDASTAIGSLSTAITTLTTALASIGANEADLEAAINTNNTLAANLQNAESRIMDADFALESSNFAKYNILNQSEVAMLAQANSLPQLVLQLIRQ